jgi:methylated-DNA-protein-cysteine methyltransferase-like protein
MPVSKKPSPVRGGRRTLQRLHGDAPGRDEQEGALSPERKGAFREVFSLVKRIPRGRVMTYGQIAELLESRLSPRAVGWAMHGCPKGVPWQRVVNASGGCSTDRLADMPHGMQRLLLEAEGVRFRANGTLPLDKHRWVPAGRRAR